MAPRDSLASLSINAVSFAAAAETTRNAAASIRILLATAMMAAGALGASRDPWKAVRHGWVRATAEVYGDDRLRRRLLDGALAYVESLPEK